MEKKVAPPPPPPLPPKKLNNNPMLSQSEIELKSLKGKSLEHKITAIDATPVTTITSIKGKHNMTMHLVCVDNNQWQNAFFSSNNNSVKKCYITL